MSSLVDTGFLLALIDTNDNWHSACQHALAQVSAPLIPSVVLPELAYMLIRNVGYEPFIAFMRSVTNGEPPLIFAETSDFERATDIMAQYADARIDWVDCVIMAMAERLNISRILTVDQRHFRILRPKHVVAFELLP